MTAASLAGFFLTLKNAILTLKGKACQGEKVEVRNAFSNEGRFGGAWQPRRAPFSATAVARRGLFRAGGQTHDELKANSSWLPKLFLRPP